jgi:hypothetical protein
MSDAARWAWRPQEGPQKALVVRLRSFAVLHAQPGSPVSVVQVPLASA